MMTKGSIHAINVHEFGDVSCLVYEDLPMPEPKAGEVLVKVEATGLNFIEIYKRRGLYPSPLPFVLGEEFAGTVEATGEGVTDFKPGDRVATAQGQRGYAEYATAAAQKLIRIPDKITTEFAAAVMLQGMTAHYLAMSTYPLKNGDIALIHAAAGGVGQLLVQIAKMCGARVIATVSNEEKAKIALQVGADEVIQYSKTDFEVEVKQITEGHGVDVVYDGVGQMTFAKGLNCLRPRGFMVLYGQASGPVEPINPQILNQKGSLYLTRPTMGHYLLTRDEFFSRANDLFSWMATGKLKVKIDRTFPLSDAPIAHRYMEDGLTKGKVLLIPSVL